MEGSSQVGGDCQGWDAHDGAPEDQHDGIHSAEGADADEVDGLQDKQEYVVVKDL